VLRPCFVFLRVPNHFKASLPELYAPVLFVVLFFPKHSGASLP
jgi:hypothetical protein